MVFGINKLLKGVLGGGAILSEDSLDMPFPIKNSFDDAFSSISNISDAVENASEGIKVLSTSVAGLIKPNKAGVLGALMYWSSVPLLQYLLILSALSSSAVVLYKTDLAEQIFEKVSNYRI